MSCSAISGDRFIGLSVFGSRNQAKDHRLRTVQRSCAPGSLTTRLGTLLNLSESLRADTKISAVWTASRNFASCSQCVDNLHHCGSSKLGGGGGEGWERLGLTGPEHVWAGGGRDEGRERAAASGVDGTVLEHGREIGDGDPAGDGYAKGGPALMVDKCHQLVLGLGIPPGRAWRSIRRGLDVGGLDVGAVDGNSCTTPRRPPNNATFTRVTLLFAAMLGSAPCASSHPQGSHRSTPGGHKRMHSTRRSFHPCPLSLKFGSTACSSAQAITSSSRLLFAANQLGRHAQRRVGC